MSKIGALRGESWVDALLLAHDEGLSNAEFASQLGIRKSSLLSRISKYNRVLREHKQPPLPPLARSRPTSAVDWESLGERIAERNSE